MATCEPSGDKRHVDVVILLAERCKSGSFAIEPDELGQHLRAVWKASTPVCDTVNAPVTSEADATRDLDLLDRETLDALELQAVDIKAAARAAPGAQKEQMTVRIFRVRCVLQNQLVGTLRVERADVNTARDGSSCLAPHHEIQEAPAVRKKEWIRVLDVAAGFIQRRRCGLRAGPLPIRETSGEFPVGVKRITSSLFQVPVAPNPASHSVTTSPPLTSTFFSFFSARKRRTESRATRTE